MTESEKKTSEECAKVNINNYESDSQSSTDFNGVSSRIQSTLHKHNSMKLGRKASLQYIKVNTCNESGAQSSGDRNAASSDQRISNSSLSTGIKSITSDADIATGGIFRPPSSVSSSRQMHPVSIIYVKESGDATAKSDISYGTNEGDFVTSGNKKKRWPRAFSDPSLKVVVLLAIVGFVAITLMNVNLSGPGDNLSDETPSQLVSGNASNYSIVPVTSISPSFSPTGQATQNPQTTTFTITGGFFSDTTAFQSALKRRTQASSSFFVHLGNFRDPGSECDELSFEYFSDNLKNNSNVPVFVIEGQNDVNNCTDPFLALEYWYKHLFLIYEHWDATTTFTVESSVSLSLFSIYHNEFMFIGLNILRNKHWSDEHFEFVLDQNAEWVTAQLREEKRDVLALILFGNENMPMENELFFEKIAVDIYALGIPVVYFFEGNGDFVKVKHGMAFVDIKSGHVPFVDVTIDKRNKIHFTLDKDNYR